MNPEAIAIEKLKTLPPERQQEVLDFIEFLQTRDQPQDTAKSLSAEESDLETAKVDWKADPFFGMWRDREDLQDSTAWIKQIRQQHWNR